MLLLVAHSVTAVTTVAAQEKKPAQRAAEKADDKKSDDKKSENQKPESKPTDEKKPEPVTAIVGGDIHTVTGAVIREGTILIKEGKIIEVGQSVEVPAGATVIDANGKTITPGFVAVSMRGIGIRSTPDWKGKTGRCTRSF